MLEEWNNGEMGFRENGYMKFWPNPIEFLLKSIFHYSNIPLFHV
jgi:hypothetical protein